MPRKPSQMPRTGKAQRSPKGKAQYAASKIGTGAAGIARDAINKRNKKMGAIMNMTTHGKKGK